MSERKDSKVKNPTSHQNLAWETAVGDNSLIWVTGGSAILGNGMILAVLAHIMASLNTAA